MKRHLIMSAKELDRLPIVERLVSGRITAGQAARELGLSIRQARRIKKRFIRQGPTSLIHQRRGKASTRKLSETKIQKAMTIIDQNYRDFGPTLAHEKLTEKHGVTFSRETLRQAMIREGLWQAKRKKTLRIHPQRARRPKEGELVQADGSPHAWFEERSPVCNLLVFIDDATGKVQTGLFCRQETTTAYFRAIRQYLKEYGKPLALYVDRHSIFVTSNNQVKPAGPTQFTRAMNELGIKVILANSPQAKGRVERVNLTLQDRLVKEMRLKGISTIKEGNHYLPEFLQGFNERFSVEPQEKENAHRLLLTSEDPERILIKKYHRVLSKNLEFQFKTKLYQVKIDRPTYAMRNAPVLVTKDARGKVRVYYRERELEYRVVERRPKQIEASAKELNTEVDRLVRISQNMVRKPAKNHPWRYANI